MNLVMLDIDGTLTQSYEYDQELFGLAIADVIGGPPVNADLNVYIDKTSAGVTREAIQSITGLSSTSAQIEAVKCRVQDRLERMYSESPKIFCEVPGAARFLERLRSLGELGIVIATGCWVNEAQFKLQASGINVAGIPMATSDDDRNRTRIMQIAAERAQAFYHCPGFEQVVYLGDGPWDLHEANSLGYHFIGIGPRFLSLQDRKNLFWHPDFLDLEAVLNSVASSLKS